MGRQDRLSYVRRAGLTEEGRAEQIAIAVGETLKPPAKPAEVDEVAAALISDSAMTVINKVADNSGHDNDFRTSEARQREVMYWLAWKGFAVLRYEGVNG